MGRIYFRQFYTDVVEAYIREAVRTTEEKTYIPKNWYKFATNWLNSLSEEDRNFIQFVFDRKHHNSYVGVSCYSEEFEINRLRLYDLEKKFAIFAGLHEEVEEIDRRGTKSKEKRRPA